MSGLVAGIGFRRGTQGSEIVALIRTALTEVGGDRLSAVATAADRAGEAAIREAAAAFGLVPVPVDDAALASVDHRVPTRSARVERLRGVGSLAEAAALAAGGSRLVLARIRSAGATCALALTEGTTAAQDESREPQPGPLSHGERVGVRGVPHPVSSHPSPRPSPAKGAGPARHPAAGCPAGDAAPPIPSGRDAAAATQPTSRKRP